MRIGTTPTHTFTLPADMVGTVAKVRVIYKQNGAVVLTRDVDKLDGRDAVFKLTQEETLKFSSEAPVSIQLRVLTLAGDALTSNVMVVSPYVCLENGVFA